MTRNHRSGLSLAIRQSSFFADAVQQSARLPDNATKSECLFYWGLRSQSVFILVAAYSFKSSRSVGCRVLTSQPTPARGGKVFVQKHLSHVSADSSTRDQPEPLTTLYIVERELACFACLCYHPLHWLRLLTLALSIGHCQCSYIFISCWPFACNLQVTWIKKYRSQQRLSRIRSHALYSGSYIGPRAALCN